MELVIFLLVVVLLVGWALKNTIQALLNRRNVLKPQRLTMTQVGLTPEQTIRFCALARSRGITQKTLWRDAALSILEEKS